MSKLNITKKAKILIANHLVDENPEAAFIIRINAGGCGGFLYDMYIDNKDIAEWIWLHDNPAILCDEFTYPLLDGWTLDIGEGFIGPQLVLKNNNNYSSCGCGLSFSPKGF